MSDAAATDPDYTHVEWDYVRARRRRGSPDEPRHVRPLLVEAGLAQLRERGPRNLSLARCARAVGINAGAPYSWFESAVAFRDAVTAEAIRHFFDDLAGAAPEADPDARLAAFTARIVEWLVTTGLRLDVICSTAGRSAAAELDFERTQLFALVARAVHDVVGCGCRNAPDACPAITHCVDAVLATCSGYADLSPARDVGATTRSAVESVAVLVSAAPRKVRR